MAIRPGIYKHYKGKFYAVLGVARHSEMHDEHFVVYMALYDGGFGQNSLWIRPLTMFIENVEWEGTTVPRFTYIAPSMGEAHLK